MNRFLSSFAEVRRQSGTVGRVVRAGECPFVHFVEENNNSRNNNYHYFQFRKVSFWRFGDTQFRLPAQKRSALSFFGCQRLHFVRIPRFENLNFQKNYSPEFQELLLFIFHPEKPLSVASSGSRRRLPGSDGWHRTWVSLLDSIAKLPIPGE